MRGPKGYEGRIQVESRSPNDSVSDARRTVVVDGLFRQEEEEMAATSQADVDFHTNLVLHDLHADMREISEWA